MNIQSTSQNNPNFGQLHAPKKLRMYKTGFINKKQLLKSKAIKECADKYDVYVRQGEQNGKIETMRSAIIGACAGGAFMSLPMLHVLLVAPGELVSAGLTLVLPIVGALAGFGFAASAPSTTPSYGYLVKGKKDDIETKEHLLVIPEDIDKVPDLIEEIEEKRQERFMEIVAKKYPEDGIFSAKNILNIFDDESIKKNYTNDEILNFNIDINQNSSLLMKFFDIKKTNENADEYEKVASIIKSTPNINFNQQDKVGISIIENILNLENDSALDIVKDVEFEYTPYMDTLFANIQDEEFKNKVKKIKVKYPDSVQVLKDTKSIKALQESLSYLDSPFCNSRQEAVAIWSKLKKCVSPANLEEVNRILYKYLPENLRMD